MSDSENDSSSNWIPPTVEELQTLLPQYEISAVLGRGSMGAVYKGRQKSLHRDVAIKVLPENFATRESDSDTCQYVERFKLEARSMANLDHPAILSVYDFGRTESGQLYIVMEFIDGMDIQKYLHHHGGKLLNEHAIAITAHVLDALQYAHDHGVVHRDIKPANVLINSEGRVKIADFGLAKRLIQSEEDVSEPVTGLTSANVVMGTPDFVAPEALEIGSNPDGRADLYAVGVMFYQMLTGKLPRGQFELPSELQPDLDPRFDAVVSRALQSNPDSRYGSATEFRIDLDRLLSRPVPKAADPPSEKASAVALRTKVPMKSRLPYPRPKPAARKKSKAPLFVGLALGTALVIGVGIYAMKQSNSGKRTEEVQSEPQSMPETESASGPTANGGGELDESVPGQEMENSIGMKLCWIPAGKFTMGSPEDEAGREPDETQVDVELTGGFWMGKFEVTQEEIEEVSEINPAKFKNAGNRKPVEQVNWDMATDFCKKLTERERMKGTLPEEWGYRLPTEAQWEYGCRAGSEGRYSGGGLDEVAWHRGNSGGTTHEVGQKKANPWGLHDMHGNVLEWCQDWYGPYPSGSVTDPQGPASGSDRVIRGGGWGGERSADYARCASRGNRIPGSFGGLGFRVVLAPSAGIAESSPRPAELVLETSSTTNPGSATKAQPFVNSLGMKFVPVPITGGPSDGQRVLFSIWETRVADYAAFIKANPGREWALPDFPQSDVHPAVLVSWNDAIAFCEWLTEESRMKGNLEGDDRYRLPADHEWSYAVGIGELEDADLSPEAKHGKLTNIYPWGEEWPPPQGAGNFCGEETNRNPISYISEKNRREPIENYDDGFDRTAPVGSFQANPFGLYDLSGNAWEWCQDRFLDKGKQRVLRGGSLHSSGEVLPSSWRNSRVVNGSTYHWGFRVVLEVGR